MVENPVRLVVLCADDDVTLGYVTELETHLATLLASGRATLWHRKDILPGRNSRAVWAENMGNAQIFIALVTGELLATCSEELAFAAEAGKRGAIVVPVAMRAALLEGSPLEGLEMIPRKGNGALSKRDKAERADVWVEVSRTLEGLIRELRQGKPTPLVAAKIGQECFPMPESVESQAGATPVTILFLSSDPEDTSRLQVAEELNAVDTRLKLAKASDRFRLVSRFAVTKADLLQVLLDEKPTILHFCGHGSKKGLVLKDRDNKATLLPTQALASLFEALEDACPRVVMMNACYSAEQAEVLKEKVECVVGASGILFTKTARSFAEGFYMSLASGRNVRQAVKLAKAHAEIEDRQDPNVLRLDHRPTIDPGKILFV